MCVVRVFYLRLNSGCDSICVNDMGTIVSATVCFSTYFLFT